MIEAVTEGRAHPRRERTPIRPVVEIAADLRNWRRVLVFTVNPPELAGGSPAQSLGRFANNPPGARISASVFSQDLRIARERLSVKHLLQSIS